MQEMLKKITNALSCSHSEHSLYIGIPLLIQDYNRIKIIARIIP